MALLGYTLTLGVSDGVLILLMPNSHFCLGLGCANS